MYEHHNAIYHLSLPASTLPLPIISKLNYIKAELGSMLRAVRIIEYIHILHHIIFIYSIFSTNFFLKTEIHLFLTAERGELTLLFGEQVYISSRNNPTLDISNVFVLTVKTMDCKAFYLLASSHGYAVSYASCGSDEYGLVESRRSLLVLSRMAATLASTSK
jgi:hypothetical protein